MAGKQYTLGMVGLGVMGSNLVLNMRDHGISVVGYDKNAAKIQRMKTEAASGLVDAVDNLDDFIDALASPRMIMLLVPAGPPVDAVIRELLPRLTKGDIIIDGGNSHFTDTNLRQCALDQHGMHLLGVGISGGEEGARNGPSIMPGGGPRSL
ncbi:MAG TPA: NAD(P)-binding domain-containing protein [Armatimonadota bacterium]|nr:NAD(P)-binding domain-containing protein [Armatimonadota bacterium]